MLAFSGNVMALPVNQIMPASLTGTGFITFEDVAGGNPPGTNFDAIFESDGADFGERFVGQTLTTSGVFDILSGTPSSSLSLATGIAGENLNVFFRTANNSQVLSGLGPLGFPDNDAIGEGSFAVLFDFDQSEFGFDLLGGNGGSAFVDFFKRDGSLISSITLTTLSDQSFAFARDGGIKDIAGISIYNNDPFGIAFDNLVHDVPGVTGPPNPIPEPTTVALLGIGLVGLAGAEFRRRRKKKAVVGNS